MVRMSADSAQLRKDMARVSQSVGAMERRMKSAANLINASFAGISLAGLVREYARASDAYTRAASKIRLYTKNSQELAAVEDSLFDVSQRSRISYETTVDAYARAARNARTLGASQQEIIKVTELVAKSLAIAGASTQESISGVTQLGQALGTELGGDELKSLRENAPRVAQAIADGLSVIRNGARVTVADLKAMGAAHELQGEVIFQALLTQADQVNSEYANVARTIGQAMTQLANDVQRAMAKADMQPLIKGIDGVRDILSDPATIDAITLFGASLAQSINVALIPIREAGRLIGWVSAQMDLMKGEKGIVATGDADKMQSRIAALREEIDNAQNFGAEQRGFRRTPEELSALRVEIMRLEKARQAAMRAAAAGTPDLSTKPAADPPRPTASGGSGVSAQDQRLKSIQSIIAALEKENATLNMTAAGLAEYELAALKADPATIAYAKSLAAATEVAMADVKASEEAQRAREELAAEIQQIAADTFGALMTEEAAMRTAAARREEIVRQAVADHIIAEERGAAIIAGIHEKLNRDIQDRAKETKDQFTAFAEEAARGIQDALADTLFGWMQGEFGNIAQDFKKLLDRMVAQALAAKIGAALFGEGFGAGGGAELGGLLGKIFGGKRAVGGPVSPGRAYLVGEKGPEMMVPSGSGRIIPNGQMSGGVVVNLNLSGLRDSSDLRQSSAQVAAQAGLAVQRAMSRNT